MSAARALVAAAAAAAVTTAAPLRAQRVPRDTAYPDAARADTLRADTAELARVSLSVHYGTFRPAGRSELYALVDRALAPGAGALRPRLAGGAMHVRVAGPWYVRLGAEAGGSSVASASRALPAGAAPDAAVRQHTTFDLAAVYSLGAEWQALRWRAARPDAPDRARLVVGAGAGLARYRLRQWGDFVDAERRVGFGEDFRSDGRGAVRYASAALEVPVTRGVGVQGTVRRQAGSAPMRADYATFDRLDLGGTRLDVGLHFRPRAARR
jgi:hypothetical protein